MGIWASPSRLTHAAENSHKHHRTLDIHTFWQPQHKQIKKKTHFFAKKKTFLDEFFVSSHLNQCFHHPYPISCLLRRAASHMNICETRQRPTKTNKIIKSQACEQSVFFSHMICLILIFTIRLFSTFECFGPVVAENQSVFLICSTVFSVMCVLTGCSWTRRLHVWFLSWSSRAECVPLATRVSPPNDGGRDPVVKTLAQQHELDAMTHSGAHRVENSHAKLVQCNAARCVWALHGHCAALHEDGQSVVRAL